MDGILSKILDTFWLRPISLPILYLISFLAGAGYMPDSLDSISCKTICYWTAFLLIDVIYTIWVAKHNSLPKSKNELSSVLFIIDAESEQFYNDINKKLVSEFEYYTTDENGKKFSALCIDQRRLKKIDLQNKDRMIKLLYKVNCMLVVFVKHHVDSVTDAENFMMHIDYAIMHPELEKNLYELLKLDIHNLAVPLKTQKFGKAETLDAMEFTAISLSITCQYLTGLIMLLSGRLVDAHNRFVTLRNYLKQTKNECIVSGFQSVLDNRLYVTCRALVSNDTEKFYLEKSKDALCDLNSKLEEINSIYPNTYDYYLGKAFYHVAYNSNIAAARECIKVCKQHKKQFSWRYSDAFLTAYEDSSPLTIYKKYSTAFKYDQDLHRIVDYIEYIIEREPERIGLHLAAGLVYNEIDQTQLAKEHLDCYLKERWNDGLVRILIEKNIWKNVDAA